VGLILGSFSPFRVRNSPPKSEQGSVMLTLYDAKQFESIRPLVERSFKRWNDRARRHIRDEMRLKLRVETKHFDVPVRVVAEWPEAVTNALQKITDPICPILQNQISPIRNLGASARQLKDTLPQLAEKDVRWQESISGMIQVLEQVEKISDTLDAYFKQHCDAVSTILAVEEDVLGAYFYDVSNWREPQRIELYYPVIGLVASQLRIEVSDLTVVVLIHELAHAYSHLGYDIDERCWDTFAFRKANRGIKEGIAQYFTDRIANKSRAENPGIWEADDTLVKRQAKIYRNHLSWVERVTPEAVRTALLMCRNQRMKDLQEFEMALDACKSGLKEKEDMIL